MLLTAGWYVASRLIFLNKAQRIAGVVISVDSREDMCGGGLSRGHITWQPPYKCIHYMAHLQYSPPGDKSYTMPMSACTQRQDADSSGPCFPVGARIAVIYNPRLPSEAYVDDIINLWAPHW